MIFYVDDRQYFVNENFGNLKNFDSLKKLVSHFKIQVYTKQGNDFATWPFDMPENIILNTAVGGSWGGAQGVDDSIFPLK